MEKQINIARLLIGIRIVDATQVDWTYQLVGGLNKKVLALKAGVEWENVYFTPGTLLLNEVPVDKPQGPSIDQQVSFRFPGDDREDLSRFGLFRQIIELEYDNGDKLVLGNPENPFIGKFAFNSKEQGYDITFARKVAV